MPNIAQSIVNHDDESHRPLAENLTDRASRAAAVAAEHAGAVTARRAFPRKPWKR